MQGEWERLETAARALLAREGLQRFSLRRLASESGWTLGALSYRLGSRQQILLQLVASTTAAQLADDEAWLARLAHLPPAGPATIGLWLDDQACRRPDTLLFWGEMLQAATRNPMLATAVHPYIESRPRFWERLLARPGPNSSRRARLLAFFLLEEPLYTLALGADPAYRLLRQLSLHRLCGSLTPAPGAPAGPFFPQLTRELGASPAPPAPLSSRAQRVATAAGQLLAAAGAEAVTHRAVAARAGLSVSAITHHFPTHTELLQHAYGALHQQLPVPAKTPPPGADPAYPGLNLVPANLLLLVEAARRAYCHRQESTAPLPEVQRLAQLRARRGGHSGQWTAAYFPHPLDGLAKQTISLTIEGELLATLATRKSFAGQRSLQTLTDLVAIAAEALPGS